MRLVVITAAAALTLAAAGVAVPRERDQVLVSREGDDITLGNRDVRVIARRVGGRYHQEYQARDRAGEWRSLLATLTAEDVDEAGLHRAHPWLAAADLDLEHKLRWLGAFSKARVVEAEPDRASIELFGRAGPHRLALTLTVASGKKRIHARLEDRPSEATSVDYLMIALGFVAGAPDTTWTPNLRGGDAELIADHVFRSPAIVVQSGRNFAALVPDLDLLARCRPVGTALDLDLAPPFRVPALAYGFCPWRAVKHNYYVRDAETQPTIPAEGVEFGFDLLLDAAAEPGEGHRAVARHLWRRYGELLASRVDPQTLPFDDYGRYGYGHVVPKDWRSVECEGGVGGGPSTGSGSPRAAPRGGIPTGRGRPDLPFHTWHNNMRSAYGLFYYGRKWGDDDLIAKARAIKALALTAPQDHGIFPAHYNLDACRWTGTWNPTRDLGNQYMTSDAATTGYWLLRWHQDLESDPEALAYCQRLAQFFLDHQQPSGAVATYVEMGTLRDLDDLKESATTACVTQFLAELYRVTRDRAYLDAAERGAGFLSREVVAGRRYWDFEAFFSCSPKPLDTFDAHTGQAPENTYSMYWTAETFRNLYALTRKREYLDDGLRALDLLCLYQQVWDAPFMPIHTFGGFGVMNTDAEWNDSRQAVFAHLFLDYYLLTGEREYFERGTAANRASFLLMSIPENRRVQGYIAQHPEPGYVPENFAHTPPHLLGARTSFDWGEGGALTSSAWIERDFGGAFIDLKDGHGFGIDGCVVRELEVGGHTITFDLLTPLPDRYQVTVRFDGAAARSYRLTVNGRDLGHRHRAELADGITLTPKRMLAITHNPPATAPANAALEITARVTTDFGKPREVALHYRAGEGRFRAVSMRPAGSGLSCAAIPSGAIRAGATVEYYLTARDARSRAAMPRPGGKYFPYRVNVAPPAG